MEDYILPKDRLKALREEFNLTQEDAYTFFGMPKHIYEKWESGKLTPNKWTINFFISTYRAKLEAEAKKARMIAKIKEEREAEGLENTMYVVELIDEYIGTYTYLMYDDEEEAIETADEEVLYNGDGKDAEEYEHTINVYEVSIDDLKPDAVILAYKAEKEIPWTDFNGNIAEKLIYDLRYNEPYDELTGWARDSNGSIMYY